MEITPNDNVQGQFLSPQVHLFDFSLKYDPVHSCHGQWSRTLPEDVGFRANMLGSSHNDLNLDLKSGAPDASLLFASLLAPASKDWNVFNYIHKYKIITQLTYIEQICII